MIQNQNKTLGINYEVFVNGQPTGEVIVNSTSEEAAEKLVRTNPAIQGSDVIELKIIFIKVPSIFQNCIMAKSDFVDDNKEN